MKTKVFDLRNKAQYDEGIRTAAEAVKLGGIAVFPTETVYGLGANAYDEKAVAKIFEAKGRPGDNPLIVHIADKEDIFLAAASVSEDARKVIDRFMPGPISVVLEKDSRLAPNVTAGLGTVAVRLPVCPEARDFIRACGVPIAAPSANISKKPSPTRAEHVLHDMDGKADVILEGYDCEVGLESTVVDMSVYPAAILRPGAISAEMLSEVLGYRVLEAYREELKEAPKAPGMKYTHYKPSARVVCIHADDPSKAGEYIRKRLAADDASLKKAVIAFDEAGTFSCENVYPLGSISDPKKAAHELFAALRYCDLNGIELAYVTSLSQGGIGDAFVNRLHKASDEIVDL